MIQKSHFTIYSIVAINMVYVYIWLTYKWYNALMHSVKISDKYLLSHYWREALLLFDFSLRIGLKTYVVFTSVCDDLYRIAYRYLVWLNPRYMGLYRPVWKYQRLQLLLTVSIDILDKYRGFLYYDEGLLRIWLSSL